ncbi:hypothetical protein DXN05_21190 [Deminuibacter soli]|uniref:Fibronectin type-III domain-containing protein n=2 Tax=Deminuibacter soli TaxID=2291815 RepID=A0A3E1NE53_9BACT|nr:hypothetical protein DXN05_21190 [Deminuibacter soli]
MNIYPGRSKNFRKLIACVFIACCSFAVNNLAAQTQYQRVYATTQTTGNSAYIANAALAADGNPQTASTITPPLLLSSAYQQLRFASNVPAGTPVHFKVELDGSLLALLGNSVLRFYSNNTAQGADIPLNSGLLGLQLLKGTNQYEIILTPPAGSNGIRFTINSVITLSGSVKIFDAYYNTAAAGPVNCAGVADELHGVVDPLGIAGALSGVTNPANAIDGNINTYSTLAPLVGALEYTQQTFIFPGISQAGDSIRVRISQPAALLDANLLSDLSIVAYNGADSVGVFNSSNGLLSLRLLAGATNQATLSFAPTAVFDRVQVRFGGVVQALNSLNIHEVQRVIPVPVLAAASVAPVICTGGTVALNATVPAGETVNWYNPDKTLATTGNAYTTPALSASATYYTSASRTGCTNTSDTLPVYIAVKTIPAVPVVAAVSTVCAGKTTTLTVSNPVDSLTYNWYTVPAGGAPVQTGVSFTTPVLTAGTTYYVEASNGTCTSPTRAAVTVDVSTLPGTVAVAQSTVQICAGSTATFTVQTPGTAVTYNWYDAATGGNLVGTGTSFTTPQLAAGTTYYAQGINAAGCTSTTRTQVNVVVNALPVTPVLTNASVNINPGQTATFTVSNPADSISYKWYSTATGGSVLQTGNSFTTPALSATTSYYVEAVNNNSGCTSSARALVTANVINEVVCGYAASQSVTGLGVCLLCNVADGDNAIGSDLTNYSTITTSVGVGGYGQLFKFGNTFYPGDSMSFVLEVPGQLINANLLGGIGVQTYSGNNANGDFIILDSGVVHLQLLNAGSSNLFRATLPVTKSFDGVAVTLQGLNVLSQLRIYGVQAYVGTPKLASGNGLIYANDQQSPVYTGVLCALCAVGNPVLAVDGDTTTYSTITSTLGVASTVGQLLKFPGSFNAGDSIQLDLEIPGQLIGANVLGGLELETYTNNTPNGNPIRLNANTVRLQLLGGGNKFKITVAANHAFNGAVVRIDGVAAVAGNLRVYDAAVSYSSQNVINVCNGSSATLNVIIPTNATINWYTVASGGTPVFTGNSYTTPPVTANTTLYIEASRYGCINPNRTPVNIVPNAIPAAPTPNVTSATICPGDSVKLYPTAPAGVIFKWYSAATGGQPIYTGDTLIAKPATTTTYYVEAVNSGCSSQTRTAVTVNVNAPAADVAVNPTAATIGVGQSASFTATSSTTGTVFNWYAQATGGTPVFTGPTFNTPALTVSTTYYLEAVTPGNCVLATRLVVPVTVAGSNGNPVPCDAATTQTNGVSAGLICVGCGVFNPLLAIDNDTTTGSTLAIVAGLAGSYVQQTLGFPFAGDAGDTVLISITSPASIANVSALGGLQVGSFNGATFNNDLTTVGSGAAITVNLLFGGNTAIIKFVPQQAFDKVQVRLNSGLAGLINTVQVNYAQRIKPAAVPSVNSPAVCQGQAVALSVTGSPNTTFKWYTQASGGSPLFVGSNFQTPALDSTTTYYVESVSATGCAAANRTPVQVSVGAAPAAPAVTNSTLSTCAGNTATAGVQNPDNSFTYTWYTTATGGTAVATGASFTTGALNNDTTFYVQASNAGGCVSSSRTPVHVTVNSQLPPPVVVNGNSANACANSAATLSIQNPQSGVTYNWYSAATGGVLVATGANFTSPVVTADTAYYVEAVNGTNCVSPRTAVAITVIPAPAAPTVAVTPSSAAVNPGDPLSMTATSVTPNVSYNWYLQPSGGVPVFTGGTYSPAGGISATTTYYVEAVSNTGGCVSARTPVTITVNPGVNLSCDVATSESSTNIGVCLLCGVSNPGGAVDTDSTTFSTINVTAGLGGGYEQTLIFPTPSNTGDSLAILLEVPQNLLSLGVLSNIYLHTFNGATDNNDQLNVTDNAIIRVSVVPAGNKFLVKYKPASIFDRVQVELTGLATVAGSVNIYYASRQVAQPVVTVPSVTICSGTTATLNATVSAGAHVEWYAAPVGGTALPGANTDGTVFTTPVLTANTVYYAQAVRNVNGCYNPNRVPVTVLINPAPTAPPVVTANVAVCSGQAATLQVANADASVTYNWYTTATGGTPVAADTSVFVTGALTANATYYVEAVNGTGCFSLTRTAVNVTVNALPVTPVVANNNTVICSGSVTLAISNPDPAVTYNWYNVANGGSIIATGSSFVTPVLTDTTTYYVEAINASQCSAGARTMVTVNVNPLLPPPAVISNAVAVCSGTAASLAVQNPAAGTIYNWYTTATGGTAVLVGEQVTTGPLTANATYYVEAVSSATGCVSSSRTAVNVTVNALPVSPVLANANVSTCAGSAVTLSIQTPAAGTVYKWYDAATSGTLLYTGENFTTPALTASATYYVEAANGSGCISSTRTVATVTVNQVPNIPVIATGSTTSICANSSATLSVANPGNGVVYNWYDAATGGNMVATGSTFATGPLMQTTTYYVEAVGESGCISGARASVTVTVNAVPLPPIVTGNTTVCANSTATLGILLPQPGITYNWYDVATGGTPLFSGTSITTGPLTTSVTYYVEPVNGACAAATRTQVTVTVNTRPDAPVIVNTPVSVCSGKTAALTVSNVQAGVIYTWYDAASGGNVVGEGSSFTTLPLTANVTYYAEAGNGTCTASARTSVDVTVNPLPAVPVIASGSTLTVCSGTTASLQISNAQPGVVYNWYDAPVGGNQVYTGASITTGVLNADVTYYAEAVSAAGCTGSARTAVAITVTTKPGAPVIASGNNTSVCSDATAALAISAPQAGYTYNWYDAATGGNLVFSGTQVTTPALTANTTYYAEAVNGACQSDTRSQVTITVSPRPDIPVVADGGSVTCVQQAGTLSVSNAQSGLTYNWYDAASGGNLVGTGSSLTIPGLTATATYFVEAYNGTCPSASRTSGTITVVSQPAQPVVAAGGTSVCTGAPTVLNVSNPQTGITYNWYDAAAGGNLLSSGSSFTTGAITAAASYYVEASVNSGCRSARTEAQITVTPPPAVPAVAAADVNTCANAGALVQVENPQSGYTYNWYNVAMGGTPLYTGPNYAVTAVTGNTVYYVEAVNPNGCASVARASVNVNIVPALATPVVSNSSPIVCPGSTVTLTASSPGATGYSWYASAAGGTVIASGSSFTTGAITSDTSFYVVANNSNGCNSAVAQAAVTVRKPLPVPVISVAGTTATSVIFAWTAVPGATGYQVSTDSGATFTQPSSGPNGLTHTISGLQPNQSVYLTVRALGNTDCETGVWATPLKGTAANPLGDDVFMPNSFTPNSDGKNDYFKPYGNNIASFELYIFTQFGSEVYHSSDTRGWDGRGNGQIEPVGVYIYVVKIKLNNGTTISKKGDVNLIR